jgi:hypothetical protein
MRNENVVPLGTDPPEEPQRPPTPPGRLHGIATLGMAVSAVVGVVAGVLYITVTWSGSPRRAVIAVILFSVLTFLTTVSAAVLTAARDSYASVPRRRTQGP